MQSSHIKFSRCRINRCGMSFVEFFGCLVALVGGLVLGSIYLGYDVKILAVEVLEKSNFVDPGLLGLGTEKQAAKTIDSSQSAVAVESTGEARTVDPSYTAKDSSAAVTSESVRSNQEGSLDSGNKPLVSQSDEPLSDADRQLATKEYWDVLRQSMLAEAEGRSTCISDPSNWQLFDYLNHRSKGHQRVIDKLDELDERGVDQRLLIHGHQVRSWNLAGTQLFSRAVDLITNGPSTELEGLFAQGWQSAATQHRMEEKLVLEKHHVVAGYLEHVFAGGSSQ